MQTSDSYNLKPVHGMTYIEGNDTPNVATTGFMKLDEWFFQHFLCACKMCLKIPIL